MKTRDIMSSPVITIGPDTSVHRIAELLEQHHISGMPVIADGKVVGIVNEAELLRRFELGTETSEPARPWLEKLFDRDLAASDYVRSHAQHAIDVMQREVVAVSEETPVQKIAALLGNRTVRRIVVLRGEQLVGIVTRGSLVHALRLQDAAAAAPSTPSDDAIRNELLNELAKQPWWRPGQSSLVVEGGVVHYQGLLENEDERRAARVAAENIPGVRGVDDTRRHWSAVNSSY